MTPSPIIPDRRSTISNREMQVRKEKWTVQVQGDMTLMNKDEAAKLNEKFRKRKKHKFGSQLSVDSHENQSVPEPRRATVPLKSASLPISLPPVVENETGRPNWVDQISSEFKVKLSEVERDDSSPEPIFRRASVIPVSPAPEKRKPSKGDLISKIILKSFLKVKSSIDSNSNRGKLPVDCTQMIEPIYSILFKVHTFFSYCVFIFKVYEKIFLTFHVNFSKSKLLMAWVTHKVGGNLNTDKIL